MRDAGGDSGAVDQHKAGLIEMVQQVFPLFVRDLDFPFDRVEVDVVFDRGAFQFELVGQALEEEHAEDEFLELREVGYPG